MKKSILLIVSCFCISLYAAEETDIAMNEEADYLEELAQSTSPEYQDSAKAKKNTSKKSVNTSKPKKRTYIVDEDDDEDDDEYGDDMDELDRQEEQRRQESIKRQARLRGKSAPPVPDDIHGKINHGKENSDSWVFDKKNPWTGCYLGFALSYGKASVKRDEAGTWTGGPSNTKNELTRDQYPLALQLGYDWQRSWFLLGCELEGLWLSPTVRDNTDGAWLSKSYWEHDSVKRVYQYNFHLKAGLLWTPQSTIYFLSGPGAAKHKMSQAYKTTTASSEISKEDDAVDLCYNFGIGMGSLITNHFEMHLRSLMSRTSKISIEEVHTGANDTLNYKPNSFLVMLSFVYRL